MTDRQKWILQPECGVSNLPEFWKDTCNLFPLCPPRNPSEVPDLDRIVPVLLEHGLERLPEHCRLSPGMSQPEVPHEGLTQPHPEHS